MSKPKRPPGYTCPKCRAKTRTISTRNRANGVAVRRRLCPSCQYRFTTHERPVSISEA